MKQASCIDITVRLTPEGNRKMIICQKFGGAFGYEF
jgi:hypothetical protein